jgi:hypothetical protein
MYLCLAGILPGELWGAWAGAPPFGHWPLSCVSPCRWEYTDANYYMYLLYQAGQSTCWVSAPGPTPIFADVIPSICQRWFENGVQDPGGVVFFGGNALVIPTTNPDPYSLPELLELIDTYPTWFDYVDPLPGIDFDGFYRLTKPLDKSNVTLKVEF